MLVHCSDRGSVCRHSLLRTVGLHRTEPSVSSRGYNCGNVSAETINGLYKAELTCRPAPGQTKESLELAMPEWVLWYSHRRLLGPIEYILSPADAEASY